MSTFCVQHFSRTSTLLDDAKRSHVEAFRAAFSRTSTLLDDAKRSHAGAFRAAFSRCLHLFALEELPQIFRRIEADSGQKTCKFLNGSGVRQIKDDQGGVTPIIAMCNTGCCNQRIAVLGRQQADEELDIREQCRKFFSCVNFVNKVHMGLP
jgi:hypothetical protein